MLIPSIESYKNNLLSVKPIEEGGKRLHEKAEKKEFKKNSQLTNKIILVSVITVVYNAEKEIERTIENVLAQTYPHLEYIIVDGGSCDRTLSIVKKYQDKIDYWRSESDRGIYDAMNKGIALCRGDLIAILNAGDRYFSDTISKVVELYQENPSSIIAGQCKVLLDETENKWIVEPANIERLPYAMIPHSSVFIPTSIYQKYSLFDISLKIASDYDLLSRCYAQAVSFSASDEILSIASPRGFSANYYLAALEYNKIRLRHQLLPTVRSLLLMSYSFTTITIHKILERLGLWTLVENYRNGSTR
jgi:glycosyltransferase involved in cell wall biosynthesis